MKKCENGKEENEKTTTTTTTTTKQKQNRTKKKKMSILSTCLTVESGKSPLAVTFITSKCILTAKSIVNARVVKAFIDICKIKSENSVCPFRKTTLKRRLKSQQVLVWVSLKKISSFVPMVGMMWWRLVSNSHRQNNYVRTVAKQSESSTNISQFNF